MTAERRTPAPWAAAVVLRAALPSAQVCDPCCGSGLLTRIARPTGASGVGAGAYEATGPARLPRRKAARW